MDQLTYWAEFKHYHVKPDERENFSLMRWYAIIMPALRRLSPTYSYPSLKAAAYVTRRICFKKKKKPDGQCNGLGNKALVTKT